MPVIQLGAEQTKPAIFGIISPKEMYLVWRLAHNLPVQAYPVTLSWDGEYPDSDEDWGTGHVFGGCKEEIQNQEDLFTAIKHLESEVDVRYLDSIVIYNQKGLEQ
jgi:hypothetical protein